MGDYEYVDYLKKAVEHEVEQYVKDMGTSHPTELLDLSAERLVYNITDRATGIVRMGIKEAIKAACYDLLIGIRWAKQNPDEGTYKKGGK